MSEISVDELIELKITQRNYEALVNRILQDVLLYSWEDKFYISEGHQIIQLLEVIEPEKVKVQKEKLIQEKNKKKE